jgi:putative holliday junction resolvase
VPVLGIDLGSKRIGVVVSDRTRTLSSPLTVLARSGDPALDHRRLAAIAADEQVDRVVVGLPLSLSCRAGRAAQAATAEAAALAALLDVPVETFDERLTTVSAERVLRERGMNGQARRRIVDKVAAAVMLQAWLDQHSRERTGHPAVAGD